MARCDASRLPLHPTQTPCGTLHSHQRANGERPDLSATHLTEATLAQRILTHQVSPRDAPGQQQSGARGSPGSLLFEDRGGQAGGSKIGAGQGSPEAGAPTLRQESETNRHSAHPLWTMPPDHP